MSSLTFPLPDWLIAYEASRQPLLLESDQEKMRLAIDLARQNIRQKTGGPFGALVLERESGRLVACGVNIVTSANWSVGHAETVAISRAHQIIQHWNLSVEKPLELVTSCEPCVMCLGAVIWSGISRVVAGAAGEDAEAIGFDEGPKPADWVEALETRGIEVAPACLREEALAVLKEYEGSQGEIY